MQRTSVHGIRYQFHPSANLQTSHLIEMAISPTILTIVLSVPILLKFTEALYWLLQIGYTFPPRDTCATRYMCYKNMYTNYLNLQVCVCLLCIATAFSSQIDFRCDSKWPRHQATLSSTTKAGGPGGTLVTFDLETILN